MTAISRERTARKEHTCSRCKSPITPGARYQEWNLTPGDNEMGNEHWWRERVHLRYAECLSMPCEIRCARTDDDGLCCVCSAPEPWPSGEGWQ
jgi:hypothetical protein